MTNKFSKVESIIKPNLNQQYQSGIYDLDDVSLLLNYLRGRGYALQPTERVEFLSSAHGFMPKDPNFADS